MPEEIGIVLSEATASLHIQWRDLLLGIGEMVAQIAVAPATAGSSMPAAITAGFEALKNIAVEESLESRAFVLFALSLATAMDSLTPRHGAAGKDGVGVKLKKLMASELASGRHVLGHGFFDNPSSNSLYKSLRTEAATLLLDAKNFGRTTILEMAAKLDVAFNSSVNQVYRARSEYFAELVDSNPEATRAAQMESDWVYYRSILKKNFYVAPVFGQEDTKVSLSQIYVPLYGSCSYEDGDRSFDRSDLLDELIDDWMSSAAVHDSVRLLFGGPGSGKSSYCKALAARLAELDVVRPVHIELQHTSALSDIRHAIETRLVSEREYFSADPIDQKDDNRPFVFIFDGLDELVVPGTQAASRVADGFVLALRGLLKSLNSAGKVRALAIVTGRDAIMQSFASTYNVPPHAAIQVLGFTEGRHEGGRIDQRPIWWSKFSDAYGFAPDLPEALSAVSLAEITNEPLLCFLLALSGYMTDNWEAAAENPNLIYDKLIGDVWERKWGEGANSLPGRVGSSLKLNSRDDFDLLMESVALAAWWGGENRVATRKHLDLAFEVTNSKSIWENFRADEGEEITSLALTFYFKKSELDSQGIEFTHKTFSEYLVSRFLIRNFVGRVANALVTRDIDLQEASERWCKFGVHASTNNSILGFLRNQIKLSGSALTVKHKLALDDWLSSVLENGLPIQKSFTASFSKLEEMQRFGQLSLVSCMVALAGYFSGRGGGERINVSWAGRNAQAQLITRLVNFMGSANSSELDFSHFNFISDHEGMFATCLFAVETTFYNVNMEGAVLAMGYFSQCDFRHSNLRGIHASRADFTEADLRESNLQRATMDATDLLRADLRGADMTGVSLEGATIEETLMDWGWWEKVDPTTFDLPPLGSPRLFQGSEEVGIEISELQQFYRDELEKHRIRRAEEAALGS